MSLDAKRTQVVVCFANVWEDRVIFKDKVRRPAICKMLSRHTHGIMGGRNHYLQDAIREILIMFLHTRSYVVTVYVQQHK